MIVVDTNILAYLLIEGDQTADCREVLARDPDWCAPLLWRSEFRNVLTLHMRHAGMPFPNAISRMKEAENLIGGRDYSVRSETILTLTRHSTISAYDAEFVGLSRELGTPLITTDKKLRSQFEGTALFPGEFVSA